MTNTQTITIQCSNCGSPYPAEIISLVDTTQNPEAKIHLLSGNLNREACPNCGMVNAVHTPLLYHDPAKELLIAYVPMELNLGKDEQERAIGDLMNQLPKENFKAYMFAPKRALTMKGLTEQIMEGDGITPEMMEAQRARVELVQQFVEAEDDALPELVAAHDAEIDTVFLQTFGLLAQRLMEQGQTPQAQRVVHVQNRVVELSTHGQELVRRQEAQTQVVSEVAEALQAIEDADDQRAELLRMTLEYAGDEDRLQALIGLARPGFDYTFFEMLGQQIGKAPADERDNLTALRDRVHQLTMAIDQQAQQAAQGAAGFLRALLNTDDVEGMVRANLDVVDDTLMGVLAANIQEAERQGDAQAAQRLRTLYQQIVTVLQEHMQPELRFINELLSVEDEATAQQMVAEQAESFGEPLLEIMEAVENALEGGNPPLRERLVRLREAATAIIR